MTADKHRQLTIFEELAAKHAPGFYDTHNTQHEAAPRRAQEVESYIGETPSGQMRRPTIEKTAEVIRLPSPNDADLAMTALPVVRHWLFTPDGTRLPYRKLRLETVHRGRHVKQTITIGDTWSERGRGYGVLTTRHQGALLALQGIWQRQGGRISLLDGERRGSLCASSWELEQALFGTHGGRQKRMARAIIQQLSSIPVLIENYIGPDGEVYDIDLTGLIAGAEFKTSRRGDKAQLGFPWVEIYLSSIITRAFEEHAVKPLDLRVMAGFKTNGAALLYPKVDHFLATNDTTEFTLTHLVERLGLDQVNEEMRYLSIRRRYFSPVAEELTGKPLSNRGYVIDARLEPTADQQDLKLICDRRRV